MTDINAKMQEGLAHLRTRAKSNPGAGDQADARIDAPEDAVVGAPAHHDAPARARLCVPMPRDLHLKVKLWSLATGADVGELVRVHLERLTDGFGVTSQRQA